MGNAHSEYCRKEKEIAEIYTKVNHIEKEVVGNGKGLVKTVPILASNVASLEITTANLDRNLDKVVKVLDHYEGERDGKAQIRKRLRWLIGLLVGVCVSLIGLLIGLIGKIP